MELHPTRQFVSLGMAGTAPQPILFSEIGACLDFAGIEDESMRREVAEFVHELDLVFLEWAAKQRTAAA